MFLQALGADNETIIYLSAIGEGTEIEPYKSIFLSQQYEDWSVTILNPSIAVTGTFYLDIQPVSQSGEWTINLSQDTISALNTVNVNLDQPLTLTQLEALTIKVEEQQPLDLQALDSLDNKLPQLSLQGDNLKVNISDYSNLVTALEAATLKANINNTVSVISDVVLDVSPVVEIIEETNSAIGVINTDNTAKQNEIITKLGDISTQLGAGLTTTVGNLPSVQPVSQNGTWTVGLPSGASTAANQTLILNAVTALDSKLTNDTIKVDGSAHTQPISGTVAVSNHPNSLTDSQLRAAPVNVAVQDLANILANTTLQAEITNNVSVVGSVDINTAGLATDANISITNDYLEVINNKLPTLVQPLTDAQLRASSVPVSVSNTPAVSQSGTWNINLPSGASTAANQTTINTSLGAINTKLPNNLTVTSNRLLVDNSGVTQPISGSVTVANQVNPLTDAQLRASAVTVDVNDYSELIALLETTRLQTDIKNNVSVIGDFYDNTGLATDANQFIGNNLLEDINEKLTIIINKLDALIL